MKQANEKSYKKYTIRTIVNPGIFFGIKYGREKKNEEKLNLTNLDVQAFSRTQDIQIGQVVAVKYENKLHRGLITDTFRRFMRPIFSVWLLDRGNSIESSADKVFKIKNPGLKTKKFYAYEINLYGVKPTTIDMLSKSPNLSAEITSKGLFYLRESDTWSSAAVNFVNQLFRANKSLYVQPIDIEGSRVFGNIYYVEEGTGMLKSLAKTLCENSFAVVSNRGKTAMMEERKGHKFLNKAEFVPNLSNVDEWKELRQIYKEQAPKSRFSLGGAYMMGPEKVTHFTEMEELEQRTRAIPPQEVARNIFYSGGAYSDEVGRLPRVSMSEEWKNTHDWEELSEINPYRGGERSDRYSGVKYLSRTERVPSFSRRKKGDKMRTESSDRQVAGPSFNPAARRRLRTTDEVPDCFLSGDWAYTDEASGRSPQDSSTGNSSGSGDVGCAWCVRTPCLVYETKQESPPDDGRPSTSRTLTDMNQSVSSDSFTCSFRRLKLGEKSGATPKVNMLRVVERNVQFLDRRKKRESPKKPSDHSGKV